MTETFTESGLAEAFNAALAEGRLVVHVCDDCGKPHMYPRYRCPFCQSASLHWEDAAGTGTLMAHSVIRAVPPRGFEGDLPYAVGIVRLDEGVQLLARLVPGADGEWSEYSCDGKVAFAPRSAEEMAARPTAWFTVVS